MRDTEEHRGKDEKEKDPKDYQTRDCKHDNT